MIPERYRLLLTAYVDGELSGRQRRHVIKLLRRSREARLLLTELQSDSQVLRTMSRPRTPVPDISLPVLETIAARRLRPGRATPAPTARGPRSIPAWGAFVAAAVVLIVMASASYVFFRSHFAPRNKSGDEVPAGNVPPAEANVPEGKQPSPLPGKEPFVDKRPVPRDTPEQPGDKTPPNQPIVKKEPGGSETPKVGPDPMEPTDPNGGVLTSPGTEIFKFEVVQVGTNVILGLGELEKEAEQKKLAEALRKEKAYRVELPCQNGTKALQKLQAVWKAQHANLVIESISQARLKKPELKTSYILYINNIMPDELTELLRQAGIDDRKARVPEQQFTAVVVRGMTKQDHKELTDLLGFDPSPVPPQGTGPLGTDPRRSVADDTANQIVRSMDTPRPEPGKPAVKQAESQTIALAWTPVRPPKGAMDIKHFMDGRKPSRPGSIEVLLVLRTTGP